MYQDERTRCVVNDHCTVTLLILYTVVTELTNETGTNVNLCMARATVETHEKRNGTSTGYFLYVITV